MYHYMYGDTESYEGAKLSRFSRSWFQFTATHTRRIKIAVACLSYFSPQHASVHAKIHSRDDTQRTSFHTYIFSFFFHFHIIITRIVKKTLDTMQRLFHLLWGQYLYERHKLIKREHVRGNKCLTMLVTCFEVVVFFVFIYRRDTCALRWKQRDNLNFQHFSDLWSVILENCKNATYQNASICLSPENKTKKRSERILWNLQREAFMFNDGTPARSAPTWMLITDVSRLQI